jgi:hypothetical protein
MLAGATRGEKGSVGQMRILDVDTKGLLGLKNSISLRTCTDMWDG